MIVRWAIALLGAVFRCSLTLHLPASKRVSTPTSSALIAAIIVAIQTTVCDRPADHTAWQALGRQGTAARIQETLSSLIIQSLILVFLVLFQSKTLEGRFVLDQVAAYLSWEKFFRSLSWRDDRWVLLLVEGYLRHLIKLLKKLGRLISVIYLDEDLELIFLREIPDIYLMIIDG
jgi:hypothetical protein